MTVVLIIVAVVGWLVAAWFYRELRRWAHVGYHGRIVIAYKRKVQYQAPLAEWYLWTRKLGKDENGRVIYRNGGVTVAIAKPVVPRGKIHERLHQRRSKKQPPRAQSQSGAWSISQD